MKHYLFFLFLSFLFLLSINGVSAVGTFPSVDSNYVIYYNFNNFTNENYNNSISIQKPIYDNSSYHHFNASYIDLVFNTTGGFLGDGAFEFFTNNSQIQVPTNVSWILNNTLNLTLSIWFNSRNVTGEHFLFYTQNDGIDIKIKDNRTQFSLTNVSGATTGFNVGTVNIDENKWYHWIITYDGFQAKSYINGVFDSNSTGKIYKGLKFSNSSTVTNKIGINYNGVGSVFNGSIDEFILMNNTLTSLEVKNLYLNYRGCVNPNEDDSYFIDVTFCGTSSTIYNLNDSNTNGAIRLYGDNMFLNCNNSLLLGYVLSIIKLYR